jgi:hypothetical protein
VGAFLVVVALIQIGILRFAYLRIGVSSRVARGAGEKVSRPECGYSIRRVL